MIETPIAPLAASRHARAIPRLQVPVPVLLGLILLLAALLRLPHLATNPGWDADEGYNYNIALNLAHGRHQMFALDFAFVQHPPLFFLTAAGAFDLFGPSMLLLRLVSTGFGLATLALLLPLGRELAADGRIGTRIGLLAALAYAVTPPVALQNRFAYTYQGLAFWTALALLLVLRYRRTGRSSLLVCCGPVLAAALTTDQEGLYLLPLALAGMGRVSWRRRALVFLLALAGPAIYLGVMARADAASLLFDITHTAGRVTGGSPAYQLMAWLYNLADLMRFDLAIPLGLAGLFLIPYRPARRTILLLLVAMLAIILKVRDPNPLFRTAEPLLPLVCLGLGALAARLTGVGAPRQAPMRGRARLAAALVLAAIAGWAVMGDAHGALTRYPTPIEGLLPRSTAAAEHMAGWLNSRLRPSDVVLAMPQVSWLFHARTAELLQAVAIQGHASAFYPAGIARRRWAYDVHLAQARFLVVDDFTRRWISQNAPERALVRRAQRSWRLVYARGEYQIYENPGAGGRR